MLLLFCDGVSNVLTDAELSEFVIEKHKSLQPSAAAAPRGVGSQHSGSGGMAAAAAAARGAPAARQSNGSAGQARNGVVGKPPVPPGSAVGVEAELAQALATAVVAEAMRRGTRDNVTVVVALL